MVVVSSTEREREREREKGGKNQREEQWNDSRAVYGEIRATAPGLEIWESIDVYGREGSFFEFEFIRK